MSDTGSVGHRSAVDREHASRDVAGSVGGQHHRHGGDIVTTDGPYLESKEHIGGFWIINVPNLDEALAWAKKATVACRGPVEVRPFQDDTEV